VLFHLVLEDTIKVVYCVIPIVTLVIMVLDLCAGRAALLVILILELCAKQIRMEKAAVASLDHVVVVTLAILIWVVFAQLLDGLPLQRIPMEMERGPSLMVAHLVKNYTVLFAIQLVIMATQILVVVSVWQVAVHPTLLTLGSHVRNRPMTEELVVSHNVLLTTSFLHKDLSYIN